MEADGIGLIIGSDIDAKGQRRISNLCPFGGLEGDRTLDLRDAKDSMSAICAGF